MAGYYYKTWESKSAPTGTNLGVAFGGWASASQALTDALGTFSRLAGSKYLDVGGGNANGYWTASRISELNSNLANIKNAGYYGVCYDIEEGDSGLSGAFTASFALAKSQGLSVLVTTSHSQPYGVGDASALMKAVLSSSSVDYVSPQLYSSGTETANDYTAVSTPWSAYKNAKAKVVVSVASPGLYQSAQSYFQAQGITTYGFISWS